MSMITCPNCGRKISNKAVKCPGCSHVYNLQRKCHECGHMYNAQETACPNCGCPSYVTYPGKKLVIAIISGILIYFIVISAITFVTNFLEQPITSVGVQTVEKAPSED